MTLSTMNPAAVEVDKSKKAQAETVGDGPSIATPDSDSNSVFENIQINIKSSDARSMNPGGDPTVGIPEGRMISFHISTGATVNECSFWIGIARQGEIAPPTLLEHASMEDLFSDAAVRGISDDASVMLTDTMSNPARYVFLMPRPGQDFRETSNWIASLVATVRSWSPESAGFYLAPEVMVAEESHDILAQVLRELIQTMPDTKSFHLLVGRHSFNAVLNTALRLKGELEGEDLNVFIYH